MSFQKLFSAGGALAALVLLAGCSAHEAPPATPVDTAKTPTFRSSANSYDQPNTPLYTQPGVNGGQPAKLPAIKATDRYDQNAHLAGQVYGEIQQQIGQAQTRYITVQSKGNQVLLGGTAPSQDIVTKANTIAKSSKGVGSVVNEIKVQKA